VSAVTASSTAAGSVRLDSVRALQHALYRSAKADPGRRFHALRDKVYRRDVLWRAWVAVRRNNGAPGIDKITLAEVEEYGVDRLLAELAEELRGGRWRPLPARRVFIPKPGTVEQRPLSIPAVGDRIVQAALKIVLEPIFEAGFLPCSFGFRPKRSAHDALQVLIDESWRGMRWVVETDIADCFGAIPHDKLMRTVEERVCDRGCSATPTRDAARRGDAGRPGSSAGHRHPTGRRGVAVTGERLPPPGRSGLVDRRARGAGALRR
jgi:retron-type reverse transcriptase